MSGRGDGQVSYGKGARKQEKTRVKQPNFQAPKFELRNNSGLGAFPYGYGGKRAFWKDIDEAC
jgi:hypothetical protein